MVDTGLANLSRLERCDTLRKDLKQWESEFAQRHGRKASREEIKLDTEIASKYKEYHRLRELLSGKRLGTQHATEHAKTPPRKKAAVTQGKDSVPKCSPIALTPAVGCNNESPSKASTPIKNENLRKDAAKENSTPMQCRMVGPTPQKDGRVLGLFDLLSPRTLNQANTPQKAAFAGFLVHEASPSARLEVTSTMFRPDPQGESEIAETKTKSLSNSGTHRTPVKDRSSIGSISQSYLRTPLTGHRNEKSPQSSTKRFLLDAFVSPSKRRRVDSNSAQNTLEVSQRQVDLDLSSLTPAFLRRNSQRTLPTVPEDEFDTQGLETQAAIEDDEPCLATRSPSAMRLAQQPRRTFARTASLPIPSSNKDVPSLQPGRMTGSIRRAFASTKSLSTMIKEIRKQRDDEMDEEKAILREIEFGEVSSSTLREPTKREPSPKTNSLLGPDRDPNSDDDTTDTNFTNGEGPHASTIGTSMRTWKKKGAKRQTRKVKMKPVSSKATSSQRQQGDVISRVQQSSSSLNANTNKSPEDAVSDDINEIEENQKDTEGVSVQNLKDKVEESAVSKKRKIPVTSTAHMNFKKLKIKNKNSKAKGRGGWRR